MASNLKVDDLPNVHAAYIYSEDDDTIKFEDRECESISKKLKKIEGKKLQKLIESHSKKSLRSKQTFKMNDDESYDLYLLHASSEEKVVFLIDGNTSFTRNLPLAKEKENSLLILPFLDAALLRFLERAEIYGINMEQGGFALSRSNSSRSLRMMQVKETFSLEEVFREMDADGNGSIDVDEFQHVLLQMTDDSSLTSDDLDLVFKSIANDGDEISWHQFYAFFDGKRLKRSSSRRHKAQLSTQLTLLPNAADLKKLKTLNEDISMQQDENISLSDILIEDEKKDKNESTDSKHVQKVKQIIQKCLNLGEDSSLMSTPSSSAADSPISQSHHRAQNSSANIPTNTDDVNVAQSLLRIEDVEDLMELMEHNIFLCPDTATMNRWENRYQYHKIRINNFRKILNGILSSKVVSMRDENNILRQQLDNNNNNNNLTHSSLAQLAELHNQQLSSLKTKKSKRKKLSSNRYHDDDDASSVDSEVSLVYTKGAKLGSKESEGLINRVKLQKKEIKKQRDEIKKLKESHKLEVVKMKRVLDQQKSKLKSYEKARESMMQQQQIIQARVRDLNKKKKRKDSQKASSQRDKSAAAASQREISVLKKQLCNLQNELDTEHERNRNLQRKITRVLSASNRESAADKLNGANSSVSGNKLARLQKEKNKLEQEVLAKTKKMDEMFLRLGIHERKVNKLKKENAELQASLGQLTSQLREGNRRTNELEAILQERDRAFAEIESLEKRIMKLNEKMAKLKSRNRKLKDRIKKLLETIAEIDRMAAKSKQLIRDLTAMQRELNSAETEALKYKNQNDSLNTRIAELRAMIKAKKDQLENSTQQLEKFANDLSAEYSVIQTLQDQIEEKETVLHSLEHEQSQQMTELQVLEQEKEDLSMELIRSRAKVESSQKIIARYKDKLSAAQEKIDAQNERIINFEQNEIVSLRSDIADLQQLIESRDAEIKLLKGKNEQFIDDLNAKRDISNALSEKNDEIDDLLNKIEALQNKLNVHHDKYKNKCNEYDSLFAKYKKLEKVQIESVTKIGKLNIKIGKLSTSRMQYDDDTKIKLKQYNVQIVTIEENKKLIALLRQQVGEYKTKWQLSLEAFERHKKQSAGLEEQVGENEKLIKSQKKKIRKLQQDLDMSGYGDSKQKSTLSLLRDNVSTMESIIRTKDFEIKKLQNNLKAVRPNSNSESEKKKKEMERNIQIMEKLRSQTKKQKERIDANQELMEAKNKQLTQLKLEMSEFKEYQQKLIKEEKENIKLSKRVSVMKNEQEETVEKLNDTIDELKRELNKVKTETERKIVSLEAAIAEKDSALMEIGKQVGTEFTADD